MADRSSSPTGSSTASTSLPSTPSAPIGGVSPESKGTSPASSRPAGKTQLDSLSREELVKHIKKQALMLQKVKAHSDDLSSRLKAQQTLNHHQQHLPDTVSMEEFQVMKGERDQALMELRSVRKIVVSEEDKHRAEMEDLEKKISDLKLESRSLEENTATKETQQALLRQQLSSQADLYSALEQEVKDRESTVADLQWQLDELRKERAELELARDAIAEGKEEEQRRHDQALADLTTERDGLLVCVTELQQDAARMREDLERATSKLESCDDQRRQLLEELKELQSAFAAKEDENAVLEQSSSQLTARCDELSQQLHGEREKGASEWQTKQDTEGELRREVDSLKQKLSDLQEEQATEKSTRELELNEWVEKLAIAERRTQEALDNQASGHHEEVRKLKALAAKLKKELGATREKEQVLRRQLDQVQSEGSSEADRLTQAMADLEKVSSERDHLLQQVKEAAEQSRVHMESSKQQLKEEEDIKTLLQERVESLSVQLQTAWQERAETEDSLTSEKNKLMESLARTAEQQGILESELSSLQAELSTALAQTEAHKTAMDASAAEVAALSETLTKEKQLHKDTQQRLVMAEKDVKAASVIDLELADYQRSVESLRSQLADKDSLLQDNRATLLVANQRIERQSKELESVKQLDSHKEETLGKLKALLVKSKKELTETRNQLSEAQRAVDALREELETRTKEGEDRKAETVALHSQLLAQEKEHELSLNQQRSLNCSLDIRVKSLQDELARTEMALRQTQQEHESYKVRVHSVLRQKATGPSVTEVERSLRQDHETEVVKLKMELKAAQERLSGLLADQEELNMEHEQLVSRHQQFLLSSQQEHRHLQDQLLESESKYQMQTRVLEELVAQLRQDLAQNTTAFKEQIQMLQKDHSHETDKLRRELESTHAQFSRLQEEADAKVLARGPAQPHDSVMATKPKNREWSSVNERAPIEERSAGEGMDRSEMESSSLAISQKLVREDSAPSLERLLSSSDSVSSTMTPVDRSSMDLSSAQLERLHSAAKRTGHLTELLHESEANCVRLAEQAKLLKEEIRRLERNQERQREAASNMEYLKNVVLKFLHSPASEQINLIPIICQLLRLSVQEKLYLQETVKGNKAELPDASGGGVSRDDRSRGWGSYMHRWTGF